MKSNRVKSTRLLKITLFIRVIFTRLGWFNQCKKRKSFHVEKLKNRIYNNNSILK